MGSSYAVWRLGSRCRARVICLSAVLACLLCRDVAGQAGDPYAGEVSTVDAYGNALPQYTRYRGGRGPGDTGQQRRRVRSVQPQRVGTPRAGVLSTLARPNDIYRMMQTRRSQSPHTTRYPSWAVRQNYARYGGFARRPEGAQTADMGMVLQRRQALIQATSLNAPVHRARVAHGLADTGLPTAVDKDKAAGLETADSLDGADKLGDWLRSDAARSHLEIRAEAWVWFRKGNEDAGNFRRAARAFEAAITLDPTDVESRIGVLFSNLSLGAFGKTVVLLAKLMRRDQALFSHELDFTALYADRVHARQVSMLCEAYAQAHGDDVGAMALHAFVLWYSGEKDHAIIAADALAKIPGGQRFADWGTQMRDVTSR